MEQILLNGLNVDQLLERIGNLFDEKIRQSKAVSTESKSKLLSRKEVSELLKISLPTLNDWTKQGWLKSYKMGNRVLYKLEEIEESLFKISNVKFKRNAL